MRITDEQKERANLVNLPQFLMSHGFDLKKVGKEYVWKEHDSLHIKDNGPGERGQWFRFSENKGGDNIGLLREYMDMSFIDAVEALTGEHIDRTYTPSHTYEPKPVQQTARELSLAEADNCRRVFAYLYLPDALELLKSDFPEGYELIRDYFLREDKVTMWYLVEKYGLSIDMVRYRIKIAKQKLKEYIILHENE